MKGTVRTILVALVVSNLAASSTAFGESPSQLRPVNLRVAGGADDWHALNDFQLNWDRPSLPPDAHVTAVDYRVADGKGNWLPATRLRWDTTQIEHLRVAAQPGIYPVEVRLEVNGQNGPWTGTSFRFDDARPGFAQPSSPNRWFAGNEPVALRIVHPTDPQPLSGIRGYAVSVDQGNGSWPCANRDRCRLEETDLRGGIEADTLALGILPEGLSVVRALAVSGSGVTSTEIGSTVVRVDATPPAVSFATSTAGWSNGPLRLTALAQDPLSGMTAAGGGGPFTAIVVDGGLPRTEPGDAASAVVSGEGVHELLLYARDAAGNSGEPTPRRASVRIDESPPTVAFVRAQDPADPERIEATVDDRLSGGDPQRGWIGMRRAGSTQRFEPLPTVVSGERLIARWNSDAYAPGTYEFRAMAYDSAGNSASSDRRDGGAHMVLANPLKTTTTVVAGFGGRQLVWQRCVREKRQRRCRREVIESFEERPRTRAVPYGLTVAYSGQLTSAGGVPLARFPVEVVETFAAGSEMATRRTTLQSGADGTFITRLDPGPSRQVEVLFGGSRTLCRASGGAVALDVLGGVRLRASASSARVGAAPVVFSGQLQDQGAPIPASGRPIELQFRLPGSPWSEFRTLRTDHNGRFRYAYAFSDDDSRGIRFQFRAVAPAQDDWPYEPAASRPVFVTGK